MELFRIKSYFGHGTYCADIVIKQGNKYGSVTLPWVDKKGGLRSKTVTWDLKTEREDWDHLIEDVVSVKAHHCKVCALLHDIYFYHKGVCLKGV